MSETPQTNARSDGLIFISYRRQDAGGHAGRLCERLGEHFGPECVFMDVSDIKPGADFVEDIQEKVRSCRAALVLIGKEWLDCTAGGRRRLDDPEDLVRVEVATALAARALVIPVLVEGAGMPPAKELPDDLKPLARRNALALCNERWDYDTGRLVEALEEGLEASGGASLLGRLLGRPRAGSRAGRYWRLFPVRLLAGLLVLAAALAPQVFLAYRPEPVRLEETGRFSPAAARLGREVLKIEAPALEAGELLLTHVGKAGEIVDLRFDRARLDGETAMLFAEENPPTAPSRVDYVTAKPAPGPSGEPCRTFVKVGAAESGPPPSTLRFQVLAAPGARELELKADGGVLVTVNTDVPAGSDERSPGCEKLLKAEPGFSSPVSGVSTVGVVAEASSGARFRFNPASEKDSLWGGADGLFQPFAFGSAARPGLRARAVEVEAAGVQAPGAAAVLLGARSAEGGEPLSVEGLQVGPDRLLVQVAGVGFLRVNGQDYADPLGRMRRHPLATMLLAVADAALLAWVIHLLLGRRRPSFR